MANFLTRWLAGSSSKKKPTRRSFDIAQILPSLADWATNTFQTIDANIEKDLNAMRDRSRDAAINNAYVTRYLQVLADNVIGSTGIQLKMNVRKVRDGMPDVLANQRIEADWNEYTKLVTPSCLNMRELSSLAIKSVARDGDVFLRYRRGSNFGKFAVQLQVYEADWVPHLFNKTIEIDKRYIRNGIEYNEFGCPTHYYFAKQNPKELRFSPTGHNSVELDRVPARDVIHLYNPDFFYQGRGYPWTHAALLSLHHLKEYTESEQIAARVAACTMGFYTKPNGDDGFDVEKSPVGSGFLQEMSPGTMNELPEGYGVEFLDPKHPSTQLGSFQKATLMTAASALGISYMTLSSDIGSANYSSARIGSLDEREHFMCLQRWLIERLYTPLFEEFLANVLTFQPGETSLPQGMARFDKFNAPTWQPRRWVWIDPQKQAKAAEVEIQNLLTTRSEVIRSQGKDPDQVFAEIAIENAKFEALGITPVDASTDVDEQDEDDDDDDDQITPQT